MPSPHTYKAQDRFVSVCTRCKLARFNMPGKQISYMEVGGPRLLSEPSECVRRLDEVDRNAPSDWIGSNHPTILLDVETTGKEASTDKIIEIGLVAGYFDQGEYVVQDTFCTLVNPGRSLEPIITDITGIRDADLHDAPFFADVADEIFNFFGNAQVALAFNAPFDQRFICTEFARCNKIPPFSVQYDQGRLLDAMIWGKWKAKGYGKGANKLGAVAERLNVEIPSALHRADVDALLAGRVFAKLMHFVPRTIRHALHLQSVLRSDQDIDYHTYLIRKIQGDAS